ncbi:MAG TPA: hypothetical protein PKA41_05605 [Verrucomicrobiota bacterium]|nr:hypothetical protein [Verrucomicrobiota bacterium]
MEDVRVFGEETENQPGHEVIHLLPPLVGIPIRVGPEQFDVKLVQSPGRLDVEGVFPDLPDRGDSRQRQEEPEVIVKVSEVACDRFAIRNVFGFEAFSVRGEDELCLLPSSRRALPERGERGGDLSFRTNFDVDVVALKDAAEVGLVGVPALEPLNRRRPIPESLKKRERKRLRVERLFRETGNCFFDLDGVHREI